MSDSIIGQWFHYEGLNGPPIPMTPTSQRTRVLSAAYALLKSERVWTKGMEGRTPAECDAILKVLAGKMADDVLRAAVVPVVGDVG